MFGIPLENIAATLAATLFGFVIHVLAKVAELREKDKTMNLRGYFELAPYKSAMKLLAVLGVGAGLAPPEMTITALLSAAGVGYAADSAVNRLKRT